ncbi:MAG: hypothetical protein BJ554DRAFT_1619 [Olpidium bornovanus]|uniref:Uncharacterized protein n=1 Tax=Olpidium bornovanus TaxID=278681 RepID=A0A8H8A0W2_9FUNG|nr:MAG: hypothetical protein BJ554DRAFT_1619 [Olpidium bornovanus]
MRADNDAQLLNQLGVTGNDDDDGLSRQIAIFQQLVDRQKYSPSGCSPSCENEAKSLLRDVSMALAVDSVKVADAFRAYEYAANQGFLHAEVLRSMAKALVSQKMTRTALHDRLTVTIDGFM